MTIKREAIEEMMEGFYNEYYDVDNFISDAKEWIKCITDGKTLCMIKSVSRTGMSRKFEYTSWVGFYRTWTVFFEALGYKVNRDRTVTVHGCGMDMNFNHCYNIAYKLHRLGLMTKAKRDVVSQKTPTVF